MDCDHVLGMTYWPGVDEELRVSNRAQLTQRAVRRYGRPEWTPDRALAEASDLYAYCPRCGARLLPEDAVPEGSA